MQCIVVFIVSVTIVFATIPDRNPYNVSPTYGCQKIQGISELSLKLGSVCDTRDACDIISKNARCRSTVLDRAFAGAVPATYPILTCTSEECSANSAPIGLPGVLDCSRTRLYGNLCDCPAGKTAAYYCGICASPQTSTCFCCFG